MHISMFWCNIHALNCNMCRRRSASYTDCEYLDSCTRSHHHHRHPLHRSTADAAAAAVAAGGGETGGYCCCSSNQNPSSSDSVDTASAFWHNQRKQTGRSSSKSCTGDSINISSVWLNKCHSSVKCGTWWRIGRVEAFRLEGHGFESRSSHHIEILGKSFTRSCLWRFSVKLHHSPCCCVGSASE